MVKKDNLLDDSKKIQKIKKHALKIAILSNKKWMPYFFKKILQRRHISYLRKRRSLGEGDIMNNLIFDYEFGYDHDEKLPRGVKIETLCEEAYNDFKLPKTISWYAKHLIDNDVGIKEDPERGFAIFEEEINKGNKYAIKDYFKYLSCSYDNETKKYTIDIKGAREILSKLIDINAATKYDIIIINAFKSIENKPYVQDLKNGKVDEAWKVADAIKAEYEKDRDQHFNANLFYELMNYIERYYSVAIDADSVEAMYKMGNFKLQRLKTDDIDEGRSKNRGALQYYEMAARENHGPSLYNLGVIYEKGYDGQTVDLEKAKEYYKKAAELGLDAAKNKLDELK